MTDAAYYLTGKGMDVINRLYSKVDELDSLLTDLSIGFEELVEELIELHNNFPLPHMDFISDDYDSFNKSAEDIEFRLSNIAAPIFCLKFGANQSNTLEEEND